MLKFATLLFFLTPTIYLSDFLISDIKINNDIMGAIHLYVSGVIIVGIISLFACFPYYYYPESIQKYCVFGGSIGINLMYVICMQNISHTIILSQLNYIFTLFTALCPCLLGLLLNRIVGGNPKKFIFITMLVSIVSMLPIFWMISYEVDVPVSDW